jgi:hypothetical protein
MPMQARRNLEVHILNVDARNGWKLKEPPLPAALIPRMKEGAGLLLER